MAATQDDILKAIKELTKEVKRGNDATNGTGRKGGVSGDRGGDVSYEGSVENLMAQSASLKKNKKTAAQANRLAANARAMGNTKAAGKYAAVGATAAQAAKDAKGGVAGAIAGIAADAAKKVADFAVKMKEFEFQEKKINLEAAKKSLQVQTALYGEAVTQAVSVGVNSVVGDAKEVTYQAMENTMELGKKNLLANIELSQNL